MYGSLLLFFLCCPVCLTAAKCAASTQLGCIVCIFDIIVNMPGLLLEALKKPKIIDNLLLKMLANDHHTLMTVCKELRRILKQDEAKQLAYLVSALEHQNGKLFRISNPSLKYTRKRQTPTKPESVDIVAEVQLQILPRLQENASYSIHYSYKYRDKIKRRESLLCWQIQFNLVSGSRQIWMYKEETRNHFAKGHTLALIQDVIPVRVGDTLSIRIPFLARCGFTDMSTLTFYKLKAEAIFQCHCEIQNHFQWTLYKYFDHPIQFEIQDIIRMYPQHLKVVEIRCAGIGYLNYRIRMLCVREGRLGKLLDHEIEIKLSNKPAKAVLKKKGAHEESPSKLQLRMGDQLVIYYTPNY